MDSPNRTPLSPAVARSELAARLAPLLEALGAATDASGRSLLETVELDTAGSTVVLDVNAPSGTVRMTLERRDPARPAFRRTRSFNVSYAVDPPGTPLAPGDAHAVEQVAELVDRSDPGALVLTANSGHTHLSPRLPLMREPRWSRAVFDEGVERLLARDGATYYRGVLVVEQSCEMACQFCPEGDRRMGVPLRTGSDDAEHLADLLHQIERARELGVVELDIGGNDVLRFSRVVDLLLAAGKLGFWEISVQSPGLVLADRAFAERIASTPTTGVCMPIYGATAAAHDEVTRTPGAFDRLCRAIDHLLDLGRPAVRLHTIALRSRLNELEDLARFCEQRFGLQLRVTPLRPNRVGEREHLGDTARLADVASYAALRPEAFVLNFPLCILPRSFVTNYAAPAAGPRNVHLFDLGLTGRVDDERARHERTLYHPGPCADCSANGRCAGVLGAYLDRFGDSELHPLTADAEPESRGPGPSS